MCGGFFALRSLPMRPPELFSVFTCIFPFFLFGSSVALCAAAGCGGSLTLQSKPPPCPPPGGLRGRPESIQEAESTRGTPPRIPLPHYIDEKEKNEHTYAIYRILFSLRAEYSTKKAVYVKGKPASRGYRPLDIGFFCTLALIREKSIPPSGYRSDFFSVTY